MENLNDTGADGEQAKPLTIDERLQQAITDLEAQRGTHTFGTMLSGKLDRLYELRRELKIKSSKSLIARIGAELREQGRDGKRRAARPLARPLAATCALPGIDASPRCHDCPFRGSRRPPPAMRRQSTSIS